ncbi:hypothetical protein GCM10023091_11220 [Ravibacter arvi]|uniref:Transporter n=1 Tax=Ravibacter arvi TaxID=2051041 RepID=A0ABP8LTX4_9BACT
MKTSFPFILTALLLVAVIPGKACDVCGCANSGSYFGLMPQSHKSIVGVRYNYLHFETHPGNKLLFTKETFHVAEAFARFFPLKRVQVMAFVPYRFDQQVTSAITKKNSGLGDISALASYNIFNSLMDGSSSSGLTHSLMLGGGIKLPTGRFRFNEDDPLQVANANFQLGTGSVDFIANAFYNLNWEKWGLSANVSRKFNTKNAENYRFGDQVYGTAELFRSIETGFGSLVPSIGVYAEHMGYGSKDGVKLDMTGGSLINGTAGLNWFTEKWTLGINAQLPIAQNSASGHVYLRDRFQVQLGFLF